MASVVIRENSIRANIIESEFLDAASLKLARAKAKRYVERRFLRVVLKVKIDTCEYWTVLDEDFNVDEFRAAYLEKHPVKYDWQNPEWLV